MSRDYTRPHTPRRVTALVRHLSESVEQERSARERLLKAFAAVLDARSDGPEGLTRIVEAGLGASAGLDQGAIIAPEAGGFAVRGAAGIREGTTWVEGSGIAAEVFHARRLVVESSPTGLGAPFARGTLSAVAVPVLSRGELAAIALAGSRTTLEIAADDHAIVRLIAERAGRELERAALIAALTDAEAVARRTSAFRDQILGIVGHDLRNPLGAVVMSAALLQKRGGLQGWQEKTVGRIRSSAARMERIISDLLSYTRTRLGTGIPIDKRAADLGELARKVVDELRAYHPDSPIRIDARGDLRGEWDPGRIEQALSNLVSNAVDHGEPDAEVSVAIDGEGDAVRVEVANRGEFPPAVAEHAFEPFRRGAEEGGRKSTGLGLGLFIAREIVRGHGGDIRLRSARGETSVAMVLPKRAAAEEQPSIAE